MKQQTILVLGGGVGGLHCATSLANKLPRQSDTKIILVDRHTTHVLHSTLYHVLAADLKRERFCLPLASIAAQQGIEFVHDTVTKIDPIEQRVELLGRKPIAYDYLVIGLGSQPNDYGITGLADHAYFFNGLNDALRLRKTLLHLVKQEPVTRVVIGGGGLAGIELTGTLVSMVKHGRLQIDVVEQACHILSGLPRRLSDQVAKRLKQEKVDIYLGHAIKKVTARSVILDNNRAIPYDLFVWTGGVKPSPLVKQAGLAVDERGRALVRSTLQAKGYSRVYVIGDTAHYRHGRRALPQTKDYALAEGLQVAESISRQLQDQSAMPFTVRPYPVLLTLGTLTGYYSFNHSVRSGRWVVWWRHLTEWWYATGLLPASTLWR